MPAPSERRLAAILFTDIVGYTALMASSEERGLRARERHRALVRPLVESHRGESIEATGDESLSVFPTVLDAVHCALAIEDRLREEPDLRLHIGIHLGDVVVRDGEVSGDGVNIASRICALSPEGGIRVSGEVHRSIRNQPDVESVALGEHELKNVGQPVAVFAVGRPGTLAAPRRQRVGRFATPVAFAAAALLAIAAAAYLTLGGRSPVGEGPPLSSIAVLPFDDMSPGGDQKWLADGMAEELIETRSRIEALRVPARTSAFAMRGKDIPTVGAELRVGSVVEGSVRRSDDQLRVTAQLIRVSDGFHLWSARYDRKLADVFAIQTEIARAIAEAIRGELGIAIEFSRARSDEPSDVRAYELVRKAFEELWHGGLPTERGVKRAIEQYEQALAIDSGYATAHAELGNAYLERWAFLSRAKDDLASAKTHLERALAIDSTNGSAHANLAQVLYQSEYQWEEARRVVDEGLAHNPGHGELRTHSALLLALQGRTMEAVVEMRRAADLDPSFWLLHWGLGVLRIFAGEREAGVEELEHAWALAPGVPILRTNLGWAYHLIGRDEDALEAMVRDRPSALTDLERALRAGFEQSRYVGAVRAEHDWLVERSNKPCTDDAALGAARLAILGEANAMFECLEIAIDRRDLLYLKANPVYDPYRPDPRFAALLRRMNLAE